MRTPILRIALTLLVSVCGGACDTLGLGSDSSPTAPTGPPVAGSAIVYAAVGASEASGIGSSVECVPFTDCPQGMGYVQVATRQLKASGFTVTLTNLGIPTAVIGRDFQMLGQQNGRTILGNLIDDEMPFVAKTTTVVTVFAGANEVNTITSALGAGAGAADPAGYIDAQVKAFAADYTALLAGLHDRASGARVVILNVPNVAGLPFLAGVTLSQRQAAQRASVGMTAAVNALASRNTPIVDLMCDARTYQPANYSSDGFHPNDAGYAFIASEVVRAITMDSYPTPQSSCTRMTLVP